MSAQLQATQSLWVSQGKTPFLGVGVGLRRAHFDQIFNFEEQIDFLEILVENFMGYGGRPRAILERVTERWPLVFHGVGLSIGALEPLDNSYLDKLFGLIKRVKPLWFSDHLSYSSALGADYHDLIPLPFTPEVASHVAARVRKLQERAEIPFLLENPTYYMDYKDSSLAEVDFINEVLEEADCGLLLDVNNVYVNAMNHGYDPFEFIERLHLKRVGQIHMAGHDLSGEIAIDTHGHNISSPVYELYEYTLKQTGPISTLLERDHNIPPLQAMVSECERIRRIARRIHGEVTLWKP